MITPKNLNESMLNSKFNTDIATSSLMQRALELYISEGDWRENIQKLNKECKERYIIMEKLIDEKLGDMVSYDKPGGGFTFYLNIKNSKINSKELFFKLREKNVFITPGVLFFRNMKDGNNTFRIGFYQTDKEKIIKGIEIIRRELKLCHT